MLTFSSGKQYTAEEEKSIYELARYCWVEKRPLRQADCNAVLENVASLKAQITDWKVIKDKILTMKKRKDQNW